LGEERAWRSAGGRVGMARILIHVEGETEETFVTEVLAEHLLDCGHYASARLIGNARMRFRRGGIRGWDSTSRDIVNHLRQDSECIATTMVDYYALPQTGPGAWPGREAAAKMPFPDKAPAVESALAADIAVQMGSGLSSNRFIPYVMMHEFEGLLFSDCDNFASGIGQPVLAPRFAAVRAGFRTPEEINDSPMTAPSKRVEAIFPAYQKPLMGSLAVLEIGLVRIRAECPLFSAWLSRLEDLP
jgi:hypothetical protein